MDGVLQIQGKALCYLKASEPQAMHGAASEKTGHKKGRRPKAPAWQ
jgi:hypothetical protein